MTSDWQLSDVAALRAALPDDGYVRYAVTDDALVARCAGGWAWVHNWRPTGHPGGAAMAVGEAEVDESAALALLAGQRVPEWFSTAPARELVAPAGLRTVGGGHWDFLWCDRATARLSDAGDQRLVDLDDEADGQEIQAFGQRHNPDFEGFPGRGFATDWVGVRDGAGDLVAVGAIHRLGTGHAHLAGIVVRADQRGHGLGRAVTEELTRRSLERQGACTLGVYSSNVVAKELYASLGYRTAHAFFTRGIGPVEV